MAKFKNKNIKTRKRLSNTDAQIKRIDDQVKKIEYKDILNSFVFILVAALFIGILIYAGISILS